MIWLATIIWGHPAGLFSFQALRVLAPAIMCMISTLHTVRAILPINERVHELAREKANASDRKETVQKEGSLEDPEIRRMQRRWGELNMIRGVILFTIAIGAMTSPAMVSFYRAVA